MNHQYRLKVEDTALLVVDMQEKLLPKIMQAEEVIRNASFLVNAAKVLGVPVLGTEQYPKGLGPTVEPIRGMLTKVWEKQTFSAVGEGGELEYLKSDARITVNMGDSGEKSIRKLFEMAKEKGLVPDFEISIATK